MAKGYVYITERLRFEISHNDQIQGFEVKINGIF